MRIHFQALNDQKLRSEILKRNSFSLLNNFKLALLLLFLQKLTIRTEIKPRCSTLVGINQH